MTSQRGATLLVSLIMLVVLTLFVISAINLTNVNLRIVGNMQMQKEIEAAAQQGIEKAISTKDIKTDDVLVDINHDGTDDYTAKLTKGCIGMKISKDTDPTVLIYDSTWDVSSAVTDTRTGASTVIHQGVAVLAGGACPP